MSYAQKDEVKLLKVVNNVPLFHILALEVTMEYTAAKDYIKISKQEYNLLKEVYRTVKRQAFLVRIGEAERNLAAGKTKSMTVDDVIASV